MYFIDEFQKGDKTQDACVMVSEVNLDELEELYKKIDEYDDKNKTAKQKRQKEEDGKKISTVYNLE